MKMKKLLTTTLVVILLFQIFCVPVSALESNDIFVETAKVGSTKIVKNGVVYDMYHYLGGQAMLQEADNTIIVPIRIVSELAGLVVDWVDETYEIILTDPITGNYWSLFIGQECAKKYNANGDQIGSYTLHRAPDLRGGASCISTEDIQALYGFQVHKQIYENGTYVVFSNNPLMLTSTEVLSLCAYAHGLI